MIRLVTNVGDELMILASCTYCVPFPFMLLKGLGIFVAGLKHETLTFFFFLITRNQFIN